MSMRTMTVGQSGAGSVATRPIRILMADDDRNDHLLLIMAAEAAGIEADFEFVDDGSTLLLHLACVANPSDLPDLIVLDLRMPGLDGHRTLEELHAHPVLWQIPVVVFTSSTRRSDEVKSFSRGARWFETKPSDFDALVEFARALPDRAHRGDYALHELGDDEAASAHMSALARDVVADVEDELLFRVPDL